jgi:hypothetical protein
LLAPQAILGSTEKAHHWTSVLFRLCSSLPVSEH